MARSTLADSASHPARLHAHVPGQAPRGASTIVVQDGRIAAVHSDADYRSHVDKTLAAVRALAK